MPMVSAKLKPVHRHLMSWGTALLLAGAGTHGGCHPMRRYETTVEIVRLSSVRQDGNGGIRVLDLEMRYVECPSAPLEVVRGDAEFAACVARHRVGDRVRISGQHVWVDEGHWAFRVDTVGECRRSWDPADEASFQIVRECQELRVNTVAVGFHCNLVPAQELLAKCPWFRRR